MNENDRERKISAEQMAIMMYPVIVGTEIISVPAVTEKYTKKGIFWLKYNR
ncbi:MAG TPA: hypothetical protein VEY70_18835 [Metabacillus sp.]|nr:hypothetical protein [Metabacillus sp.]